MDAFVDSLVLAAPGFDKVATAATTRPPYHPGDLLKLYIYGSLNQVRPGRRLERQSRCRTIYRRFHAEQVEVMNRRAVAQPALMRQRPCLSEHPFGTIKRMTGNGRFLVRGLISKGGNGIERTRL